MTPSAHATSDRETRLLRRLGYDLVDAGARGHFHICREGSKVNDAPDLFGLTSRGRGGLDQGAGKLRRRAKGVK